MRTALAVRLAVGLAGLTVWAGAGSASANETWRVSALDAQTLPKALVPEEGAKAPGPDGLGDGRVAVRALPGDIVAAWYVQPTRRYGHGVLGDAIEAGGLKVRTRDGKVQAISLSGAYVFEDRTPRLDDLDGDGKVEVITLRASLRGGGAVSVFGLVSGRLRLKASTPFIGTANRWLNVAGMADFAGLGRKQIAYVETPHIGGTLYFYDFSGSRLKRIDRLYGFSNHVIGSRELRLSAVADINGDGRPDLALPSARRRALRMVGFVNGAAKELAAVKLPGRIDKAIKVEGSGADLAFLVGLSDGRVFRISRR